MKLYKIIKAASGCGANKNCVSIESVDTLESVIFIAKVKAKAEQIFGKGASLNAIGTTYGIHVRFDDLEKNKRIAKTLIKIVELEEELRNS